MTARMDAVIFDVDGTLCDVRSVRHHVMQRPKNFDAFHAESIDCPPNQHVIDAALQTYREGTAVLVVTSRRFRWRYHTILWLWEHGVPYDDLYMRGDRDDRKDADVKRDVLRKIERDGYRVIGAYDDNPAVIALWESEGIPVTVVDGWVD